MPIGTVDESIGCVVKPSSKTHKGESSESFWVGEHVEIWGQWDTWTEGMDGPCPLPMYYPMHLLHLVVPELYPPIINR